MIIEIGLSSVPTQTEQLEGKPEKLVCPMTAVVAENNNAAILRFGVENADAIRKSGAELSRVRVHLRPVA